MIYSLICWLDSIFDVPGAGLFSYISFRSACSIILALVIAIFIGKKIIRTLQRHQIGEEIRNLGLEGQLQKKGTPTMGGLIIIGSILLPILIIADLSNVYIQLLILTTLWLGAVGFIDDYIKTFKKHKEGMSGWMKIAGQVGLGIIVGTTMWLNSDIVIREKFVPDPDDKIAKVENTTLGTAEKSPATTVPFFKNSTLNYRDIIPVEGKVGDTLAWLLYVAVAIFIITAVSNGSNLTDGLDGLATGVSAPIVLVLGIVAYVSGNIIHSDFLNIIYIPGSGELMVFAAATIGALLGFLWYNCYPAQVFMGDTGSLTIGGIIAVFSLLIRIELLLPILCGIFLIESLSVIIQVGWFKYTRKKYGEGRRIFLMSPIHHHFQKKDMFETKIVLRFWIIQILLAAITLITLKIR